MRRTAPAAASLALQPGSVERKENDADALLAAAQPAAVSVRSDPRTLSGLHTAAVLPDEGTTRVATAAGSAGSSDASAHKAVSSAAGSSATAAEHSGAAPSVAETRLWPHPPAGEAPRRGSSSRRRHRQSSGQVAAHNRLLTGQSNGQASRQSSLQPSDVARAQGGERLTDGAARLGAGSSGESHTSSYTGSERSQLQSSSKRAPLSLIHI